MSHTRMTSTGRTDCMACTHLDGGVFCEPRGMCLKLAEEVTPPRTVKMCLFRACDWTIEEPASLLQIAAMDAEIKLHMRTHRPEIELLTRYIQ